MIFDNNGSSHHCQMWLLPPNNDIDDGTTDLVCHDHMSHARR
jgi:hypothetical protein